MYRRVVMYSIQYLTCYSLHCHSQKSSYFSFLTDNSHSVNKGHWVQQIAQVHKCSGNRKENTNSIRQSSAKPDCSIRLANGTFKSSDTLLHLLALHCAHVSTRSTQGSAAASKLSEATDTPNQSILETQGLYK